MSEKKNGNSGGFLTKTGMTVIVLLCVCIAGMSYSIFKAYRAVSDIDSVTFDKDAWQDAISDFDDDYESEPTDEPYIEDDEQYFDAEPYADEALEPGQDIEVVPVFNDSASGLSMTMPMSGRVICDYSADDLVYSETFDDWRVHLGIDIASAEGTPVTAAAAGVVEKVYDDDSLGLTVIIRHTSYVSTLYAGLSSCDLSEGAVISEGATVGLSGATAAFENARPAHLHFEVLRDGTPSDPYEYLIFEE